MTETRPLVPVVGEPRLRCGRGGLLGPDTYRRTHWWDLTLACGHRKDVTAKYRPRADGRVQRGGSSPSRSRGPHDVLPPPRRCRCDECPRT